MSSRYPSETIGSGSSATHPAMYPQTSTALSPMLSNFQRLQQTGADLRSSDTRVVNPTKGISETIGSALKQQSSSSIIIGRAGDLSPSSPYRVMTGTSLAEPGSATPLREFGLPPLPTSVPSNLSAIPNLQNNPSIIRQEGNVIYSTQPLTAADFGGMTLSGSGNLVPSNGPAMSQYMQPSSGLSYFPTQMSSSPMTVFNPMPSMPFGPSQNSFFSGAPMTPRLLGPMMPLTPRGFPQMQFQAGQVGLTPRSYHTEQIMTSSVIPAPQPTDPALFMFAESFKNQCIAMQHYYAAHPDELVDSPRSTAREAAPAQPRKGRMQPSLRPIPDQENYNPMNQTPSPTATEKAIKQKDDDDVMEILNRLVGEDRPRDFMEDQVDTVKSPVIQPAPVHYDSPVVTRRTESGMQSFFKKFACGTRA